MDALLVRRDSVIVLDNFCTGQWSNCERWHDNSNVTFIASCVTGERILFSPHVFCKKLQRRVSQIYHLACPASPVHYQSDAIQTLTTNFVGTLNPYEMAISSGATISLASTTEVYGDPLTHPQSECCMGNVNPIGPRACYDEGKLILETICMDFHRRYGIDIRISRIFNTYGPRMCLADGRVVSNFIVQGLQKQCLSLYGDGGQTPSFCFVRDLVFKLVLLMNAPVRTPVN